jgi:polysaccharide export outer membrane protein
MRFCYVLLFLMSLATFALSAPAAPTAPKPGLAKPELPYDYQIVPGDVLEISVWREEGLDLKILVRPDGGISFPLIGSVVAGGRTVDQLRDEISKRLGDFLSSPEVTVAVVNSNQKIYVVGKVGKPGEFLILKRITVMQALAMAGGLTPFADRDDIGILRRKGKDELRLPFDYDSVESGEKLEQNILLQDGDVVVVP